jgi:replicative DNA helicase
MAELARIPVAPIGGEDGRYISPPQNIEAEQALLAAILARNSSYEVVAGILRPEHFSDALHANIFAAIERERAANLLVSPVTLANEFDKAYLARLFSSVVTTGNNHEYARVIIECWQRRELLGLAEGVQSDHAAGVHRPIGELREDLDKRLTEIFAGQDGKDLVALNDFIDPTIDRVQEAWRNRGKLMGVTTGLVDLDRALGGLMPGHLIIIAGRPAMGKSTTAKTVALAAARAETVVPFFSLEMSAEELTQWCLADMTGISAMRQRIGGVDENDIANLVDAGSALRALPLLIDDTPGLSIPQIRARCRRMKRQRGIGLVVVDHLGLITASREARKQGETACITEVTKQLKQLAKELHVPIVALSQLSRAVEGREDKRPTLPDLRQSGSIEQDADIVIFCYRAEYYLQKAEPQRKPGEQDDKYSMRHNEWCEAVERAHGLADLIVAKQRGGPEATVKVRFEPEHSRMANLARGI